jgi:hypothetical protein
LYFYLLYFFCTAGSGIVFSEGTPYSQTERISIGRELFSGLVSPSHNGASAGAGAGVAGNGGDDDGCTVMVCCVVCVCLCVCVLCFVCVCVVLCCCSQMLSCYRVLFFVTIVLSELSYGSEDL